MRLLTYFTGIECKNAHKSPRYTKTCICVECSREHNKKWRTDNSEKRKKSMREWKIKNKKRHAELNKASELRNPEVGKKRRSDYQKNNPEIVRVSGQNRRSRERGNGGKIKMEEIQNLYKKSHGVCASCFKSAGKDWHLDHIMPLALGGRNEISNCQVLCKTCNMRKAAKHPIDWALENGRLV